MLFLDTELRVRKKKRGASRGRFGGFGGLAGVKLVRSNPIVVAALRYATCHNYMGPCGASQTEKEIAGQAKKEVGVWVQLPKPRRAPVVVMDCASRLSQLL